MITRTATVSSQTPMAADGSYSHHEAWEALGDELEAHGLYELIEHSLTI
jgi:hypothetical protein